MRRSGVAGFLWVLLVLVACGIKGPEVTVEELSEGMSFEEVRGRMSGAGWSEVFCAVSEESKGAGVVEYEYISESGALWKVRLDFERWKLVERVWLFFAGRPLPRAGER